MKLTSLSVVFSCFPSDSADFFKNPPFLFKIIQMVSKDVVRDHRISSPLPSTERPRFGSFVFRISYEDIINFDLSSPSQFDEWREVLFYYLRQEKLEHVIHTRPDAPLGLNLELAERDEWIQCMLAEEKVKSILLHTIPLAMFKENMYRTAQEIFVNVLRKFSVSAGGEAEASGRGQKRKRLSDAVGGE